MKRSDWAQAVPTDAAHRRAGGRARYNMEREKVAFKRRQGLLRMLGGVAPRRGELAGVARRLGVSKATACRDLQLLQRTGMLKPAPPTFAQLKKLF